MLHNRCRWLRVCAEGTFALLFTCAVAHAQQAGTPTTLPPTVEPAPTSNFVGKPLTTPDPRLAGNPATATQPAVPCGVAADQAPCNSAACDPSTSVWSKVPPPVTFPRLGAFFILPTGPGYYSLKDVLTDNYREKPPVYPWPPFCLDVVPFYDNNFRYLDNPDNTQTDWLDCIKRIHLGDNWLLSFGGEERIRFNNELDSRLSGKNNIFESERTRLYADLWYRDVFRAYAEFLDVEAFGEELPPGPTDINKSDMINFFVDLK